MRTKGLQHPESSQENWRVTGCPGILEFSTSFLGLMEGQGLLVPEVFNTPRLRHKMIESGNYMASMDCWYGPGNHHTKGNIWGEKFRQWWAHANGFHLESGLFLLLESEVDVIKTFKSFRNPVRWNEGSEAKIFTNQDGSCLVHYFWLQLETQ